MDLDENNKQSTGGLSLKPLSSITLLKYIQIVTYSSFFGVSVVLLITQTIQSVNVYLQGPTYTETLLHDQENTTFPVLTICPLENSYKLDVLKFHGIQSIQKYNFMHNTTWSSKYYNISESTLFDEVTQTFEDTIHKVAIRFFRADESENFMVSFRTNVSGSAMNHLDIVQQQHRKFGKCYSIRPRKRYRKLGIYYIKITLNIGAKLYVHAPDQFLDLSGRMGHKIFLGQKVTSQVKFTDFYQLERELPNDRKSCSYHKYDDCMYSNLYHWMINSTKDHCTVPWIRNNDKICTKAEDINKAFMIAYNRVTNQYNDCDTPCHRLIVDLGAKEMITLDNNKTTAVFHIYFPQKMLVIKENYLYTVLNLLAEIGGYMGLLLGYSLFNIATCVNKIIDYHIKKKISNINDNTETFKRQ